MTWFDKVSRLLRPNLNAQSLPPVETPAKERFATSSNFLSQSVSEIAGIYAPGTTPHVRKINDVPLDVTAAHEQGHKELCDTTSIGIYLKALSVAKQEGMKAGSNASIQQALTDTIDQCWMVQEGYATIRQLCHCHQMGRSGIAIQIEKTLPPSYISAIGHFQFDIERIRQDLVRYFGSSSNISVLVHLAVEYAAYVIAHAAMSVPIAEPIRKSNSLPSYELANVIRRNSPDARLKKLSAAITAAFVRRCFAAVIEGTREAERQNRNRPLDERLVALSRKCCALTGLSFEPSDRLNLRDTLSKLGCEATNFSEIDERDVPRDRNAVPTLDIQPVGSSNEGFVDYTLAAAEAECNRIFRDIFSGFVPSVVCEVGTIGGDRCANVYMQFFIQPKFLLQAFEDENDAPTMSFAHPDTPMRVIKLYVRVSKKDIWSLPTKFKHTYWSWVVSDVLCGDSDDRWQVSDFRESGKVYIFCFPDTRRAARKVVATYALPNEAEGQGENQKYALPITERGKKRIPHNAVLTFLDPDPDVPKAQIVRMRTAHYAERRKMPLATFELACLGEGLLEGWTSLYVLAGVFE